MQRLTNTYSRAKKWYIEHERFLIPAALFNGFVIDWFTVTRIDRLYENVLLGVYLIIVSIGILVMYLYDSGKLTAAIGNVRMERFLAWLRLLSPLLVQFAFGGMFSVLVVFYVRSSTLGVSWLFILILVGLLIGNERFKDRYEKLSFQISILFFAIFSFSIFYVPVIVGEIGTVVFLLSGAVSLFLVLLFLWILSRAAPKPFFASKTSVLSGIFAIFVTINIFYFINIIPPIPLSLKAGEVVHRVERINESNYLVYDEQQTAQGRWYGDILDTFKSEEIRVLPGEPVYFWSSVFAPTDLNAQIVHHWQYQSSADNDWYSVSRIAFFLSGGREAGFRGYSFKRNIFPGLWRVDIETVDGRVIGRKTFEIIRIDSVTDRLPIVQTVQ